MNSDISLHDYWKQFCTAEEVSRDEKYAAHLAGECDWESCEWCIAAALEDEVAQTSTK